MDNKERALRLFFNQIGLLNLPTDFAWYTLNLFRNNKIDPMVDDYQNFFAGAVGRNGVFVKLITDDNNSIPASKNKRELKDNEYFMSASYNDIACLSGSAADLEIYFSIKDDVVVLTGVEVTMYMMS